MKQEPLSTPDRDEAAPSKSRSDGMERLKVREQEIENAANELDQLFRQRHKHDDVTHLLKRLVNRCDAPVSERGLMPSVVWPKERTVGRMGEMAPMGEMNLTIHLQDDGDVIVVCDEKRYSTHHQASVEFCSCGSGGGRSPRTRDALVALMVAIETDNADNPERAWPPQFPAERNSDGG